MTGGDDAGILAARSSPVCGSRLTRAVLLPVVALSVASCSPAQGRSGTVPDLVWELARFTQPADYRAVSTLLGLPIRPMAEGADGRDRDGESAAEFVSYLENVPLPAIPAATLSYRVRYFFFEGRTLGVRAGSESSLHLTPPAPCVTLAQVETAFGAHPPAGT